MIATIERPLAPRSKPAAKPDRAAELRTTISASRLSVWVQCRLKFYFRYVAQIQRPPTRTCTPAQLSILCCRIGTSPGGAASRSRSSGSRRCLRFNGQSCRKAHGSIGERGRTQSGLLPGVPWGITSNQLPFRTATASPPLLRPGAPIANLRISFSSALS